MPEPGDWTLFLGLPVPARWAAEAPALVAALESPRWELRPAEPADLHLTLSYLGPRPQGLVDDLRKDLGAACHARRPFDLPPPRLAVFPEAGPPRVVVLRVADPEGRLEALRGDLLRALGPRAPAGERELPFVPHVTLARVVASAPSWDGRALGALAGWGGALGPLGVEEVRLFRSLPAPARPRYAPLAALGLGRQK